MYPNPVELLQTLIRFDTTNPPGNEAACISYIDDLLHSAGFQTTLLAKDPNRPNLITRLKGRGEAPPLLLYGHVDVVTTANQQWSRPPFAGEIIDDFLWGRGALDMKSGVAMILTAFLRAHAEGLQPAGDVVLAILSDEEAGADYGAKFLVEEHPEQFANIRYALGEFGGFPAYFAGKKFYFIQVSEKQVCWLKATVRGEGGHGSLPKRGGTMAKVAKLLQKLDENRLPVHITPVMRQMFETMAAVVPPPDNEPLLAFLDPVKADKALDALGPQGLMYDALLHNVANATIIRGGDKINVIPSEVEIEIDCRMLPGFTPVEAIAELQSIVGEEVAFELVRHDPGPAEPDMGLFDSLSEILKEADPTGVPVPYVVFGSTDGRHFTKLDIQTYGFLPMNLPADFDFLRYVHAADERIPVDAVGFGADAVYEVLRRF